jgi:UDP-N-acetylglucosamine 2-epimerase (non-hydrolysing)
VPEETNRKIIDHCSTILLPYTRRSKENLLIEGIANEAIYVTGNPIYEVIQHFSEKIESSRVLSTLKLQPGKYFLVTAHREENVDNKLRLRNIFSALERICNEYHLPIVCSIHPRTRDKLTKYGISPNSDGIILSLPFGFFDFISLEKNALCVITDSGTVQEECCILGKSNITIRDVTERPETIECGSNMLTGTSPDLILNAIKITLARKQDWEPPPEYLEKNVSSKVVKIVLGHCHD